jgi:RNA polymerase sigma factor (sigma-70 family)
MNKSSDNDKQLINRLKAGDESAFEQAYNIYHKGLYGMAVTWLKNRTLAKDAVQNVYLRLWNYRTKLDSERSETLQPLLTTFLRNEILNTIRSQKRRIREHIEFSRQKKKSSNSTEETVFFSDYHRIKECGLKQLSYRQEQIHRLRTEEGLSNKEVAKKLDISIHAVKSQYYLASRSLREYMRKHADLASVK